MFWKSELRATYVLQGMRRGILDGASTGELI